MRPRLLIAVAVTAAAGLYLLRAVSGPDRSSSTPDSARATAPALPVAEPAAAPTAALRNVFEYVDAGVRAAPPPSSLAAPAPPVAASTLAPPPAPPAVRLVGLLRRGAQLKVALAIAGETYVLASGESAAGYTVMGIDEDEGVRVRTPDGATIILVSTPNP